MYFFDITYKQSSICFYLHINRTANLFHSLTLNVYTSHLKAIFCFGVAAVNALIEFFRARDFNQILVRLGE